MNKINMESKDLRKTNIEKIKELFPNVVTETKEGLKIDFNLLKNELVLDIAQDNKEKYVLSWSGKKDANNLAYESITKTLRPVREKSLDFDNTKNIYIEGDNLEALKILQESYLNKIKCIYIDPPYNTGHDFIYNDKFQIREKEELLLSGQIDEDFNRLVSNRSSEGKYHSNWLSMMYPRLKLARSLLSEDGIIFISIDDNEIDNLKKICDEIFGEDMCAGIIHRRKNRKPHNAGATMSLSYEFLLVYYKKKKFKLIQEYEEMFEDEFGKYAIYPVIQGDKKERIYTYKAGIEVLKSDLKKGIIKANKNERLNIEILDDPIIENNILKNDIRIKARYRLTNEEQKFDEAMNKGCIFINSNGFPKEKRYRSEFDFKIANHHWDIEKGKNEDGDEEIKSLFELKGDNYIFSYPKPVALITKILQCINDKNALVLDFFAGSSTTAHAVLEQNKIDGGKRRFIMIQIPELIEKGSLAYQDGYQSICDIGEERIRRAGKNYNQEIDCGFRVYKIDSSNMKDVFYEANNYDQKQLSLFNDNLKSDRSDEDLLIQVLLNLGYQLDLKIKQESFENKKIYIVENNELVACFTEIVDLNIIEYMCQKNPRKIVFKDASFGNDSLKINVFERIKKIAKDTEIYIL
ncbi:MAG: site-specific DNA-methyltransferase [Firmicutes bacterium]|nr:site-specific DNA-methyltransferase [Bacillota bacterium]